MSKTTKSISMIVCGLISMIIGGFMLVNMWRWFIAEPFSIKPINFWQATGIDLMITYVVTLGLPKTIETDKEIINSCCFAIIFPLLVWLFGFICYLFM
mgnify:CR=1 FL=1|jgi:hypothetical protein